MRLYAASCERTISLSASSWIETPNVSPSSIWGICRLMYILSASMSSINSSHSARSSSKALLR